MFVLTLSPHYFDYYNFMVSFEVRNIFNFVSLCQNSSGYLEPTEINMKFWMEFCNFYKKNVIAILIDTEVNLLTLGDIGIDILILRPICE